MTAAVLPAERKVWGSAAGVALALHGVVATAAVLLAVPHDPPVPEPVVLVELPPAPPSAQAPVALNRSQAASAVQPVTPIAAAQPRVDAPLVRTPVPADAVTLPPPAPVQRAAPAETRPALQPAAAPAPALSRPDSASAASAGPGSDPRAKAREMDYYAILSAYLNRRKSYPAEARQARQQGVVTVRFTVDRNGGVSAISLKKSSGHGVLDDATLALLQRVAPLPKMPASMARDSITLALPIEYSLRTN